MYTFICNVYNVSVGLLYVSRTEQRPSCVQVFAHPLVTSREHQEGRRARTAFSNRFDSKFRYPGTGEVLAPSEDRDEHLGKQSLPINSKNEKKSNENFSSDERPELQTV